MEYLAYHKNPSVLRAIRAADAHVLFLPPYSPNLNLIEQAYAKIKHRLRNAAASATPRLRSEYAGVVFLAKGSHRRDLVQKRSPDNFNRDWTGTTVPDNDHHRRTLLSKKLIP